MVVGLPGYTFTAKINHSVAKYTSPKDLSWDRDNSTNHEIRIHISTNPSLQVENPLNSKVLLGRCFWGFCGSLGQITWLNLMFSSHDAYGRYEGTKYITSAKQTKMMDFEANFQNKVLVARTFLGDLKAICSRLQVASGATHPSNNIILC